MLWWLPQELCFRLHRTNKSSLCLQPEKSNKLCHHSIQYGENTRVNLIRNTKSSINGLCVERMKYNRFEIDVLLTEIESLPVSKIEGGECQPDSLSCWHDNVTWHSLSFPQSPGKLGDWKTPVPADVALVHILSHPSRPQISSTDT